MPLYYCCCFSSGFSPPLACLPFLAVGPIVSLQDLVGAWGRIRSVPSNPTPHYCCHPCPPWPCVLETRSGLIGWVLMFLSRLTYPLLAQKSTPPGSHHAVDGNCKTKKNSSVFWDHVSLLRHAPSPWSGWIPARGR